MPSRLTSSRSSKRVSSRSLHPGSPERLVEQQDARFFDDRPRQGETLLLPAAQERAPGDRPSLRVGRAPKRALTLSRISLARELMSHLAQGKRHVLEDIQVRPNRVGLKHHADVSIIGAARKFARSKKRPDRRRRKFCPCSGVSRPATERRVVVLPQPLGPSRVKKWPCCECRHRYHARRAPGLRSV